MAALWNIAPCNLVVDRRFGHNQVTLGTTLNGTVSQKTIFILATVRTVI
jgi:hypothetical protein